MSTLLIYFILKAVPTCGAIPGCGHWELFAIERINAPGGGMSYCTELSRSVARAYDGKPGNMLAICTEGEEVGA